MLAVGMTAICLVICGAVAYRSYQNSSKNIIDGGAQNVVTIGVLFTFIGIAIGLYNFDTSTAKMGEQLDIFLDGMKTAFWTSIVGMIAGIVIKFFQAGVEQKEDEFIRKNLASMEMTNNAVKDNTATLSAALAEIKSAIEASNNVELQKELRGLVTAMGNFVTSTAESRADMKNLSDNMAKQSQMLEQLSTTLTKSIDDLGERQSKNLSTLSSRIVDFGKHQAVRLEAMNKVIEKMQESTLISQENSAELLRETKDYQQRSLSNDETQMKILTDNANQIAAMKISFDQFLHDMVENYNRELINALNISIQNLNTQLQSQFGDNFKELNAAVREVVTWQREYKNIVEMTTDELKHIDKVFTEFSQSISVEVAEYIDSLTESLKIFTITSNQNVSIQQNLNDTAVQLADVVNQSKASLQEMHKLTADFGKFSEEVLEANNAAIKNYREAVEKNLAAVDATVTNFNDDVKKLQATAVTFTTDTEHYLRDFRTVSGDVMLEIRKTIEAFEKDFSATTKTSVENLQRMFVEIGANTDKQSEKAVNNLAAALATINNQMIDNYSALIARIAELDRFVREGGINE